jgi:hypothetical protein
VSCCVVEVLLLGVDVVVLGGDGGRAAHSLDRTGREWNTDGNFRKGIRGRVETVAGKIIQPMSLSQVSGRPRAFIACLDRHLMCALGV